MRGDASFLDQPGQHGGGAIGAVAGEPFGVQAKALPGPVDHVARGTDLGLADGARPRADL